MANRAYLPDSCGPVTRGTAEELVDDTEPYLLVGSLMCFSFGPWRRPSRMKSMDREKDRKMRDDAVLHLKFVSCLYEKQVSTKNNS